MLVTPVGKGPGSIDFVILYVYYTTTYFHGILEFTNDINTMSNVCGNYKYDEIYGTWGAYRTIASLYD